MSDLSLYMLYHQLEPTRITTLVFQVLLNCYLTQLRTSDILHMHLHAASKDLGMKLCKVKSQHDTPTKEVDVFKIEGYPQLRDGK